MAGKNGFEDRVKKLEDRLEKITGLLHSHGIHVPSDEDEAEADAKPNTEWPT